MPPELVQQAEFVALDLETTGLFPAACRIVEIGAVRFRGDGGQQRLSRPGRVTAEAAGRGGETSGRREACTRHTSGERQDRSRLTLRTTSQRTDRNGPGYSANLLRRLVLPRSVRHWSLRTLREKRVTIGAKVVRHARSVTFQLAEVAVPRTLFREILRRIARLRPRPSLPPG